MADPMDIQPKPTLLVQTKRKLAVAVAETVGASTSDHDDVREQRARAAYKELRRVLHEDSSDASTAEPDTSVSPETTRPKLAVHTSGRVKIAFPRPTDGKGDLLATEPALQVTDDLGQIKRTIRRLATRKGAASLDIGALLKHVRTRRLFVQDGYWDFDHWLKDHETELRLRLSKANELIAAYYAFEEFLHVTFTGDWKMTVEDVVPHVNKLAVFNTALANGHTLKQLEEPFKHLNTASFREMAYNRPEAVPRPKGKRGPAKEAFVPEDANQEAIVKAIQNYMEPLVLHLKDQGVVSLLERALLSLRATNAAPYQAHSHRFLLGESTYRFATEITSIADAKYFLAQSVQEMGKAELAEAIISARLADDPVLKGQIQAAGYKSGRDFLLRECEVDFDVDRYIERGRTFLKFHQTIPSDISVTSDLQITKLDKLPEAKRRHGCTPALIWRYFHHDVPCSVWEIFATHDVYEPELAKLRLTKGQENRLNEAIFDLKTAQPPMKPKAGSLWGDVPCVVPVLNDDERRLVLAWVGNLSALVAQLKVTDAYVQAGEL